MTSLGLLAHAGHPASPVFNTAFYATAATVIPVLYLALAVQSNADETIVKAVRGMARRRTRPADEESQEPTDLVAYTVVYLTACAIAGFGVFAEIMAVYALYAQRAEDPAYVLLGVVFLTIMTGANPAGAVLRILLAYPMELVRRWLIALMSEPVQPDSPATSATTKPGKTDTEG